MIGGRLLVVRMRSIVESEFIAVVNGRTKRLVGIGLRVMRRAVSVSRQDSFHLGVGEVDTGQGLNGGFANGREVV